MSHTEGQPSTLQVQEIGLRHPIERLPIPESEDEVSRMANEGMESLRRIRELTDRNFMRTARTSQQPETKDTR